MLESTSLPLRTWRVLILTAFGERGGGVGAEAVAGELLLDDGFVERVGEARRGGEVAGGAPGVVGGGFAGVTVFRQPEVAVDLLLRGLIDELPAVGVSGGREDIDGEVGVLVGEELGAHVCCERALLEATTKCFPEPEYLPASTEMPMTTAKITGMRMVVILKALPRTCSRYSRLAMSRISRIDFFSHGLDEDFFE